MSQTLQKLIDFCRHTGLRRAEPESIKGRDIYCKDSQYYIRVRSGKGGKERMVLDKAAMLIVSRALGHNRISVMAYSYLY